MAKAQKAAPRLKFLAHFEANRGGQDVYAADRDEAVQKGEAAARRLGTVLCDVTGPDDEGEED